MKDFLDSKDIAKFLGLELQGANLNIIGYSSLNKISHQTIVFVKKLNSENIELLNQYKDILAIIPEHKDVFIICSYICSANPRLDFIRVINKYFANTDIPVKIHPSAVIEEGAFIGKDVTIGANCYIGKNVVIGDNTIIFPNVVIYSNVEIGTNCQIKPGVVIGGSGFGYERDENGIPLHFPHSGKVIIGNNVHIGSNTCIDRATIDSTVIGDNTKIDNLCQIAHNCHIGRNCIITGFCGFCGGTNIGDNCWVGPHSVVYQKLRIENDSKIGIGSVVLRNVKSNTTVLGYPATKLKE